MDEHMDKSNAMRLPKEAIYQGLDFRSLKSHFNWLTDAQSRCSVFICCHVGKQKTSKATASKMKVHQNSQDKKK